MRLLFCCEPFKLRQPDPDYAREVAAAEEAGLSWNVIDFEELIAGKVARALRRVESTETPELAVYRGWMLRPSQYRDLYDGLARHGLRLINTPEEYRRCHYLPDYYPLIEGHTPRSVWTADPTLPIEQIMALLKPFGSHPVIVKDYVKSRKYEWAEACYIPAADDAKAVERVVRRFLELQGPDLNEGLVFREFAELEPLAGQTRAGLPLTKEARIFFLDGQPLAVLDYWPDGGYGEARPPLDEFTKIAKTIPSRFFTMDVALRTTGEWIIVELGDGQVSGLPDQADTMDFYRRLAERR